MPMTFSMWFVLKNVALSVADSLNRADDWISSLRFSTLWATDRQILALDDRFTPVTNEHQLRDTPARSPQACNPANSVLNFPP